MTAASIVEKAVRLRARAGWRDANEHQQEGRENGKAALPGVDRSIHAGRVAGSYSRIKHLLPPRRKTLLPRPCAALSLKVLANPSWFPTAVEALFKVAMR
jgi:hypothetical protein